MSNLLGQKETHSCICSPCSFSSALCMCKAQLRIHTAAVCGAFSSQPLFEAWMLPEDHTLTWNRPKAAAQGFISFSVSEILIINCCFPIISSFRTASGYKGGWADGRKEHRSSGLPKLSGLSTWIPLLQDGSCAPRCPSHLWIPLMNVRAHICLCFPEFTPRFEDGRLSDSSDAVIQQGEMKPFCT